MRVNDLTEENSSKSRGNLASDQTKEMDVNDLTEENGCK